MPVSAKIFMLIFSLCIPHLPVLFSFSYSFCLWFKKSLVDTKKILLILRLFLIFFFYLYLHVLTDTRLFLNGVPAFPKILPQYCLFTPIPHLSRSFECLFTDFPNHHRCSVWLPTFVLCIPKDIPSIYWALALRILY